MQSFVIVLMENERSCRSWQQCVASSKAVGNLFAPAVWHGVKADYAKELMEASFLRWTYPLEGVKEIGGLQCSAYRGHHWPRVACALAHFQLWQYCAEFGHDILVQEDDSLWLRRFDPEELEGCTYGAVSLNDPKGNTRSGAEYHRLLHAGRGAVAPCPQIDPDASKPQGLPGNSCYHLRPWFAEKLIIKVRSLGLGPNDSTMCRQWFPGMLGCLRNYATKTNGRPSLIR